MKDAVSLTMCEIVDWGQLYFTDKDHWFSGLRRDAHRSAINSRAVAWHLPAVMRGSGSCKIHARSCSSPDVNPMHVSSFKN